MQAPSGGNGKAIAYGVGIVGIGLVLLYIFYKLGEMSQRVERVENNQKPRPNRDNEAPIDVTPETVTESAIPTAIVTTEKPLVKEDSAPISVTRSESRFESAQSAQSDSKSVKTIEKPAFEIRSDSNLESDPQSDLANSVPDFRHSEDFRTVHNNGQEYHLTLSQARVVERLWGAHQNKTPEVHQATLLEKLEIYSKRVRDVFKNSKALGALVVKGEKKGCFKLNLC